VMKKVMPRRIEVWMRAAAFNIMSLSPSGKMVFCDSIEVQGQVIGRKTPFSAANTFVLRED